LICYKAVPAICRTAICRIDAATALRYASFAANKKHGQTAKTFLASKKNALRFNRDCRAVHAVVCRTVLLVQPATNRRAWPLMKIPGRVDADAALRKLFLPQG
jgi:hypothetical protein